MSQAVKDMQQQRAAIASAWTLWSKTPDGKMAIDELEHLFSPPSMIKKSSGVVDPYATLSANGAYEVIQYIRSNTNE